MIPIKTTIETAISIYFTGSDKVPGAGGISGIIVFVSSVVVSLLCAEIESINFNKKMRANRPNRI